MAVSALIAGLTWQPPSRLELITRADPAALVYQPDQGYEQLSQLVIARRQSVTEPQDQYRAARLARLSLAMYRSTGHRRFIGMAKTALLPWQQQAQPEPEIWLLRARLQQTDHHFEAAAADLSMLNRRYPGILEALLLEADAWRRAGNIARAKRVCLAIALAGRMDLSRYCTAELLLSQGNIQQAGQLLAATIGNAEQLPISERNWAYAIYADSLVAAGQLRRAVSPLARVVQSGQASQASIIAYADVLLGLSQWRAVVDLLAERPPTTAALLRLAKAHQQLDSGRFAELNITLERRMAAIADGDNAELHLRERALYALWLTDDAAQALQLARRNWQLQKGWEDAELLLQIAARINDRQAIADVAQWRQQVL